MKATEMIEILQHCIEVYGDCDLVRLNHIGMTDPITEVEFIGGSRVLVMSDKFYDRSAYKLYQSSQRALNEERKKDWEEDCNGEKSRE